MFVCLFVCLLDPSVAEVYSNDKEPAECGPSCAAATRCRGNYLWGLKRTVKDDPNSAFVLKAAAITVTCIL